MKRYITLIIMLLFSLGVKAQLVVEPGSFKEVPGFVIIDHDKTDVNDVPFAVIKIRTQNIDDMQRRKLTFGGNAAVDTDIQYKVGEVWLYLTYHADYIKISHPDFSSTEFAFPYDMKPYGCYELTLVNNSNFGVVVPVKQQYNYLIVKADQQNAMIYIDDAFIGTGSVSKSCRVGEKHRWRIECSLYHTESGEASITEGEKVKVEKTLRPAFGYINITSTPESGATVLIDGNVAGSTPLKTDRIASGEHKVRVMKEMYSTAEKTVTVTDGNTTQATVALSANFVNVTVTTDSNSDIYIDNELKGKGRWTGRLSDGSHTFEARRASHRSSFKNVTLTLGKDEDVSVPNPTPIYGTLDINSDPMEAAVIIDGVRRGETPAIISDILIGSHELKIVKQGCAPIVKTITVEEGQMITVNEKLNSGKTISITTGRSGDEIYIDDVLIGKSPLETAMGYGTHKVKAVRDGVFFVTANGAMMNTGLMSYGLTVGSVKKAGWFVSVMSNFNFGKADADSDGDGNVNGIYPAYTTSKDSRLSIIGGVVIKLDGPVCMRIGAGYGKKEKLWNTEGGKLVKYGGESYSGVDTSLGLQLNIKGLTVSLDAVTTNFKTLEAKIGIGCCIRKK